MFSPFKIFFCHWMFWCLMMSYYISFIRLPWYNIYINSIYCNFLHLFYSLLLFYWFIYCIHFIIYIRKKFVTNSNHRMFGFPRIPIFLVSGIRSFHCIQFCRKSYKLIYFSKWHLNPLSSIGKAIFKTGSEIW